MADALLVTCPQCHSKNRVPAERLGDGAQCGRCHQALFQKRPVALDLGHFDRHLQADLPLLVDFWAPWCGPCKQFAPVFERLAAEIEPRLRLAKVNTEEQPALAQRFGIRSIPSLILFRGGREVARQAGALSGPALLQWLRRQGV